jgi:hypothetical protein
MEALEKQLADFKAREVENAKIIAELESQKVVMDKDFDIDNIPQWYLSQWNLMGQL